MVIMCLLFKQKTITCKQLFHLTVALKPLMQTLWAGVGCVCTHLTGLPDREARRDSALPPLQTAALTPAASCPPTVTFINSLSAGEFLRSVSRCSAGSAEVSDEVRHRRPAGWEPITTPVSFFCSCCCCCCCFRTVFQNAAVKHTVYFTLSFKQHNA